MPPKKRALAEADANVQPQQKRQSTGGKHADAATDKNNTSERDESPETEDDDITKQPPYSYMCIPRPYYAGFEVHFDKKDVNTTEKSGDGGEMFKLSPADHPSWQYKIMSSAYIRLADQIKQAEYTDPDKFGLNCYTDTHAYGVLQVLENILEEFNRAWDYDKVDDMYSVISTLAHWLNTSEGEMWYSIDDGEKSCETGDLLGAAILATLEELYKAGELKSDSKYIDLGLVMALHLKWSNYPAEIPLEEVADWRPYLVGYAKTAGIDLAEQGVAGLERFLEGEMDLPVIDEIPAIEKNQEADDRDLWSYHKKFMDYDRKHDMGGSSSNILKWSRKERKEASYTGKDPLQHIPVKDLQKAAGGDGDLEVVHVEKD